VPDPGILGTVSSITAGFGITVLFFRIDRELRMAERRERIWIPWADWLLFAATMGSLIAVLLPLVLLPESELLGLRVPAAGCAAALVCLTGYVVGALAHYRLIFASGGHGPRANPEPAERVVVIVTAGAGLLAFAASLFLTA
jgi:hypothetical protein